MELKLYIMKRVLLGIPMLFILLTVLFVILHIMPGDPVEALYGEKGSPEFLEEMRHRLGLDKPLLNQYFDYFSGLLSGNLGYSIHSGRPVIHEIIRTWPVTLQYCILTTLFSIFLGLFLGIISALKKEKIHDFIIRGISLVAFSLPAFWLGLLLQFVFCLRTGLFPLGGIQSLNLETPPSITGVILVDSLLTGNMVAFVDVLRHLVLPSIALAAQFVAVTCRVSRANIVETLGEDYITTARAKGASETVVLYRHALKNAILPVMTIWAWSFAGLLGGSIIIEKIFTLPGMGSLLFTGIMYRDYPLIQGILIFFAIITMVVSVILDVVYALLDPRIRYS